MTAPAMPARKKVAVLGGGVGAMVAAFELTQEPGWQHKYEITVYQLGWRLGGKGASGRERDKGDRILEHGLHIWCGFYDNSFRVMRQCYEALNRPPEVPITNIEQAFLPVNQVFLSDFVADHPHIWRIDFPPNDEVPGTGGVLLTPRDYLLQMLEGLADLIERFPLRGTGSTGGLAGLLSRLPDAIGRVLPQGLSQAELLQHPTHLHAASAAAGRLPQTGSHGPLHTLVHWLLHDFIEHLGRRTSAASLNPTLASVVATLEIGAACAKGMLEDRVLQRGFDAIDDIEWSAWVIKHGASETALQSAAGRCAYDYVFGMRGGNPTYPNRCVAAGTAMRAMLRLLFTYKGALFFKMAAGMGDIVFAPFHQALKDRGVNFRYFHKVSNLGLSADGLQIDTIAINRQATLKDRRDGAEYQPLYDVRGLPCWPSTPLYEQLEEGDELQAKGIDLESYWSGWAGVDLPALQRGRDFDLVVLGISLGALPYLTPELVQRLPAWRAMTERVQTVATQAMQFWFDKPLSELGWPEKTGVLTGYYEPMDTWSDMSFLLPRETWPEPGPQQVSYFCSPFKPTEPPPPLGASDYPQRQLDAARQQVMPWIEHRLPQLLPGTEGDRGRFDCGSLYAPQAHTDAERLDAQYFRVNLDPPSELYVQSVPGSTGFRLTSEGSGVANLFLAGDWVRTGLNAGCVEAAAMAGLQAARAISGREIPIVGESDLAESPLAAQNADLPWRLLYAEGQISSAVVTLALPLQDVVRLLLPGLKLLPQTMTAAGTHPVGLIFAEQRQVRANLLPVGGMSYHECAIAIPFLGFSDPAAPQHGTPLMLLPALYLDSVIATLAGRLMYGYRKQLARVSGPAARQEVRTLLAGDALLQAQLLDDGPESSYYDFEHLGAVRAMMDQPIVTHDPLRGWLYSFMDYRFEQGRVTPLRGQVVVAPQVLGNADPRTVDVASVRTAAAGAFLFEGGWTLTNPLESQALQAMIERRGGG